MKLRAFLFGILALSLVLTFSLVLGHGQGDQGCHHTGRQDDCHY